MPRNDGRKRDGNWRQRNAEPRRPPGSRLRREQEFFFCLTSSLFESEKASRRRSMSIPRCVPWASWTEWSCVSQALFSGDVSEQRLALEVVSPKRWRRRKFRHSLLAVVFFYFSLPTSTPPPFLPNQKPPPPPTFSRSPHGAPAAASH